MLDDNYGDTLLLDAPVIDVPVINVPAVDAPVTEEPKTTAAPTDIDRRLSILGVKITDVTRSRAVELIEQMIVRPTGQARTVFFVNAHTLNLATSDASYRRVLKSADYVFGDGTGVRWAARLQGIRVLDNLVGTDLTPELFRRTSGRGHRYFLLGGQDKMIRRAARFAKDTFFGWTLAGYHHGYLNDPKQNAEAIRRINESGADLLLVGMGNPIQERWIYDHRHELEVPVCMGVGGLFGYWAGEICRSPVWLRRCGAEWLGILLQQPSKAWRYLAGNPLFLQRICRERFFGWSERCPSDFETT